MKHHIGLKRGFHHLSAAWYGPANLACDRECVDNVMVGFYHPEGGTSGEFCVSWERLGGKVTPVLRAYDDSWSALHQFSDVLAKMAEHDSEDMTPQAFCELLNSCGVEDMTQRAKG